MSSIIEASVAVVGAISIGGLLVSILYRRVVPSNEVHAVQRRKKTISYGTGQEGGNVYIEWPTWVPLFGITKKKLIVSVFEIPILDYVAYDKDKLPFKVDIMSFFRISDSNVAAMNTESFDILKMQLKAVVESSTRVILGNSSLEEIMKNRQVFGGQFSDDVSKQVAKWGVEVVRNLELLDIRDSDDSQVIKNIMAKKQSEIDRDSRVEIAKNNREAAVAETEAEREQELAKQVAEEAVGIRTAQKEKSVGLENETTLQEVALQKKITKERDLEVKKVEDVKTAEILKEVEVVKALQAQEVSKINAEADKVVAETNAQAEKNVIAANSEAEKNRLTTIADGQFQSDNYRAQGIAVIGKAEAEAETLILLAPVEAQIKLATEIGENAGYQQYLISKDAIDANKAIGIEQAKSLIGADVKLIINGGDVNSGLTSLKDVFTAKGGTGIASMLEGLAQTEIGKDLVNRVTGVKPVKEDKPVKTENKEAK